MLDKLKILLFGVDDDLLAAFTSRMPNTISVSITEDPSGRYVAKIKGIHNSDEIVTEAETGQELLEMVNDAIYTVKDVPESYRPHMGGFVPPANVVEELKIKIPAKYLNTTLSLGLQKA